MFRRLHNFDWPIFEGMGGGGGGGGGGEGEYVWGLQWNANWVSYLGGGRIFGRRVNEILRYVIFQCLITYRE